MEPYLNYVSATYYKTFRDMKTDEDLREFIEMCAGDKKNDPAIKAQIEAEIRSLQDNREKWEALCKDKVIEELEQDLEKAEGAVQDEKAVLETQKAARAAERDKIHALNTQELHDFVQQYHYDSMEMHEELRAVLNAPACAKGTALLLYWELQAFWMHTAPTGFERKTMTDELAWRERKSAREGFFLEVIGRIVSNAFNNNSIPFDLVEYLSKTPSKVKNEHEFVSEALRPNFPRCLTNSKYDASTAW